LNVCPKLFSLGQASWQAEQGIPYFLAKAGIPRALWLSASIKAASKTAKAIEDATEKNLLCMETERVMLPPRNFAVDRRQEKFVYQRRNG
jgi:hypothetical protein